MNPPFKQLPLIRGGKEGKLYFSLKNKHFVCLKRFSFGEICPQKRKTLIYDTDKVRTALQKVCLLGQFNSAMPS